MLILLELFAQFAIMSPMPLYLFAKPTFSA
nr:MAG TPA: hypothetical protein [Caudoviricetes sp.]